MRNINKKPKILLFDIESSHNLALTFGMYDQNILHENILIDRYIFCISYRWHGEKKIHTISILDDKKRFKKNIHDDYYVLDKFREIYSSADAQVAHFGKGFDLPMVNARLAINGLAPLPKIINLDTRAIAKKYFRFNCNKLDYLAKILGYKGKLDTTNELWFKCFHGDEKALKYMAKYNRQDVDVLQYVFDKLIPYMQNNPLNMSMFLKGVRCVNCGSPNIQWRGFNYTRVNKYRRFVCKDCHAWGNERTALKEDKVLVK